MAFAHLVFDARLDQAHLAFDIAEDDFGLVCWVPGQRAEFGLFGVGILEHERFVYYRMDKDHLGVCRGQNEFAIGRKAADARLKVFASAFGVQVDFKFANPGFAFVKVDVLFAGHCYKTAVFVPSNLAPTLRVIKVI
jgi:hypothetical protein